MATQQWNWSFTPTRATPAKDLPSNTDWKRVIPATVTGTPEWIFPRPALRKIAQIKSEVMQKEITMIGKTEDSPGACRADLFWRPCCY